MRIVLDTNVIISAVYNKDGVVGMAYFKAFEMGDVLISSKTFFEFVDVSGRKKFAKKIPEKVRKESIKEVYKNCVYVHVDKKITDCPDPKDNKFLELAVCGEANYIISGDSDLLDMSPYRGIPILRPKEFLEKYG